MALNRFMHPRNRYKDNKPDFAVLAQKYPDFRRHVSATLSGKVALDFRDPEALRALTCTLLKEDFGIDLEIPLDRIIPTIPLRLNYVMWLEDLLKQSGHAECTEIHGIDIGCGASCIYPLLGAKINSWHFVASEINATAAGYALHNVKKNDLSSHIQVLESRPDDMLCGVTKAAPRSLYHFTMCNPPFFSNILEAQGIMTSRSDDRAEPNSVSTAAEGEMIWEEGGEVDFIGRMIADSLQLRQQVVWYTSMVGKKASLEPIKQLLAKHKIRNVTTTEFCQGRTMRWGIGWTFYNDFEIPVSPSTKRFKPDKERPPLVINVPEKVVQNAVGGLGQESKVNVSGSEEQKKVKAVGKVLERLFTDLEIAFTPKPGPKHCLKYALTAVKDTWSNQRQKRRQLNRRLNINKKTVSIGVTGLLPEHSKRSELGNRNEGGQLVSNITPCETMLSGREIAGENSTDDKTKLTCQDASTTVGAHLEPVKLKESSNKYSESLNRPHVLHVTEDARRNVERPIVKNMLSTPFKTIDFSAKPEIGVSVVNSLASVKCADQTGHIVPVEGSRPMPDVKTTSRDALVIADSTSDIKCTGEQTRHIVPVEGSRLVPDAETSGMDSFVVANSDDIKCTKDQTGHISSVEGSRPEYDTETTGRDSFVAISDSDMKNTEDQTGHDSPVEGSRLKHDAIANSDSDRKSTEDQTGHIETLEGSRPTSEVSIKDVSVESGNTKEQTARASSVESSAVTEFVFKCTVIVKATSGQVDLEMTWVEGQTRESMHEVRQYIKNQLNKM